MSPQKVLACRQCIRLFGRQRPRKKQGKKVSRKQQEAEIAGKGSGQAKEKIAKARKQERARLGA